jgi:hypothetical protein
MTPFHKCRLFANDVFLPATTFLVDAFQPATPSVTGDNFFAKDISPAMPSSFKQHLTSR